MSKPASERLREMWQWINEPAENPERLVVHKGSLWRLFKRFYIASHWPSLIAITLMAAVTGLWVFVYAWAGMAIADDVIQVGLQKTKDAQVAPAVDPTLPGEHRNFTFGDNTRPREGLDEQIQAHPGKTMQEKLRLLGWISLIIIINEIIRHGCYALLQERLVHVGQKVQFRLRQQLHDKLHELPLAYHDRHSPGRLLTHLFSDVSTLQNGVTALLREVPPYTLNILIGLVVVMYMNASLGWVVIVTLPFYAICYQWFEGRLRVVNENLREREGRLNAHISNRISSFQVVKSFTREGGESLDFLRKNRPIIRNTLAATMLSTGFTALCGIITGVCTTLILWRGCLQVRDGKMTVGELLMFFSSAAYLFTPIAVLTSLAGIFHRTRAVAAKVLRVLDEPVTLADPEEAVPVPKQACELKLDNVSLRYDPKRPPAVTGVSFTLPAGKRMCVMGASGSGKSTLAKLIARLYDPSEGQILYDGTDVRSFKIADLRDLVGYVSQEPVVFSGTIGENIRYGSENAPFQAVVTAAQYAKIHSFIEKLPERYRTLTHERGLTLSGGQKQRVTLARALLFNPPVLVLDDCTSALDADTEAQLIETFKTALKDRTCVLISHRVSIAMGCDYVLVMDNGKATEFGPPKTLVHGRGPFAKLYQEQMAKARLEPVPAVA